MVRILPSYTSDNDYEMPPSALLKYYFHRVATKISTPKETDERDLRARRFRRQAKHE